MDLDKSFVAALLRSGIKGLQHCIGVGVSPELLVDDGKRAYEFAIDYFHKYGALPEPDVIDGACGVVLEDPSAPVEFLAEQVLNRRLHGQLRSGMSAAVKLLEANETRQAFEALQQHIYKLQRETTAVAKTISISSLGDIAIEWYRKIKLGERGILTPWDSLNEATFGFWPEDFILIVARLGVGKTWALLKMAHYARKVQNKPVLFVSTEMSKQSMALRWASLEANVSYSELRHGRLDQFAEHRLVDALEAAKGDKGLEIVGGDFDFRIETLDTIIAQSDAEVVFVDGAYLLRTEGPNRLERASNTYDEIKRISKRRARPLIASTQFNREVKTGSKASSLKAEKVAQTDTAGWNADQIYGMYQTKEMWLDKRMGWQPMKIREGFAQGWQTAWDLDKMNFEEVAKGAGSNLTSDADEYGTGVNPDADTGDSGDAPF